VLFRSINMKYIKSEAYDKEFLKANMMGPNCMKLLENLTEGLNIKKGSRVLDLGCGAGLTSIFLAKEYGLLVFATDLWISATDNFERFKAMGLEDSIIPIHAEAHELPYAEEYFDAAISVDSYHFFGNDTEYLDKHLAPLIKKGGLLAIVVPGMIEEYTSVPEELTPFLTPEGFDTLHSRGWWEEIFRKSKLIRVESVGEFTSDELWRDWLACDSNEYALRDREMFKTGGGKYFNFTSVIGRRV
jgi:cyclopropane fatty-acyl-phospholipid synthase-like methyltransferase